MGQTQSRTEYQYAPLELQDRHIRLLSLYPSSDENATIRCSVAPHSLNWNPPYEALSYTWGDPSDICPKPVDFNGFPKHISSNLEAALRVLRFHDRTRILWIDALCINQKDIDEKNRQIAMMGSIYETAQNVVVWLGPESEDSELAMSTISNLNTVGDFELITKSAWVALENLFSRPWFSRIWVLQEFKRGRNPMLQCGKNSFFWDRTGDALQEFWTTDHDFSKVHVKLLGEIGKVVSMASTRLDVPVNANLTPHQSAQNLVRMLRIYGGCEATEPHDKIYGLLGLSNAFSFDGYGAPRIDYSRPVGDVYTDWARFLISTQGSLQLLYISQRMQHDPSLPSWVPDWRTARHDLLLTLDIFPDSFRYSGPQPEHYQREPWFEENERLLLVKGYVIATFSRAFMFFDIEPSFIASKLDSTSQNDQLLACLMMGCKLKNVPGSSPSHFSPI